MTTATVERKRSKASLQSEAKFRAALKPRNDEMIGLWLGAKVLTPVRCGQCSRVNMVRPHGVITNGKGTCRACGIANRSHPQTEKAERIFRAILTERTDEMIGPWLGNRVPTPVRCGKCRRINMVRPTHIISHGQGTCYSCAMNAQDSLYLVAGNKFIKVGITTGDGKSRLWDHAHNGMPEVLRYLGNLPLGVAAQLEVDIIQRMKEAGHFPIYGMKEHFDRVTCEQALIDMVDKFGYVMTAT